MRQRRVAGSTDSESGERRSIRHCSRMWLVLLLFFVILGLFAYYDTRKPKNFPPGPPWMPVLGSALYVQRLRKQTGYLYRATAELAKRYGPVVGLRIGKDQQVVLCGYEAIRDMLSRDEFDGRPQGIFYETRTWGKRRGVLLTDEEFWQDQRRFVLRHLREFGFGRRTMADLVEQEAGQLVKAFQQKLEGSQDAGVVMSMHSAFSVYVLNTLWSILAGIRFSHSDAELKKLQGLLTELFANIDMVGCLFSQFPMLRFLAPTLSGYKQFMYTHQKVWTYLKAELDKHKATFQPDDLRDFMDAYLKVLSSNDKKPSFTESQLLAICMDMFMAGSETTTKSLGFCFLYLLLYPDVQRRAQAEIDAVVGRNRLPSLNDRPKMPYMEAVVLESVRMFMGRTFSIPHRALKDTELQGYYIPKDTMIICNFNGTLMDKDIWGDPDVFRPERFIDAQGSIFIPDQYTPFGFGKHRCMGETLAKSNVFLFTASLLQNFNFSIPPGSLPPTTEAIDGVTPSPKPYQALVTPRAVG